MNAGKVLSVDASGETGEAAGESDGEEACRKEVVTAVAVSGGVELWLLI